MAAPLVVGDSSVWIEFLRSPGSAEGRELAGLLRAGRVAVVGPVLAELLQGARTEDAERALEGSLSMLPLLETGPRAWREAGRLGRRLRALGRAVPLSDLVVAACALENGASVYTTDEHFERIPELALHRPA